MLRNKSVSDQHPWKLMGLYTEIFSLLHLCDWFLFNQCSLLFDQLYCLVKEVKWRYYFTQSSGYMSASVKCTALVGARSGYRPQYQCDQLIQIIFSCLTILDSSGPCHGAGQFLSLLSTISSKILRSFILTINTNIISNSHGIEYPIYPELEPQQTLLERTVTLVSNSFSLNVSIPIVLSGDSDIDCE